MNDIKTTPATDEEVNVILGEIGDDAIWCNCDAQDGDMHKAECNATRRDKILARIAADAEIIKAARQERDSVKEALVEAREKLRAKDEEIERLSQAPVYIGRLEIECGKLRAQVETLREALAKAVELYESYGLVAGRVGGDPRAPGRWVNSARAALAATEPKG